MKALTPTTASSATSREQLRRRVYLGVTLFSWAGQALLLLLGLFRHLAGGPLPLRWDLVYGLALCSVVLILMLTRWATLRQIEYGVLLCATLGVVAQLVMATRQPAPLATHLYFTVVLLFLAAFSILPVRQALAFMALLYAGFAVLALTRPGGADTVLLTFLGIIGVLTVQLTLFGRQISTERTETLLYQTLALTDPLTGLDNRRAMYPRLDQAHLATSSSGVTTLPAALLLFDIDHFKRVNDLHGHQLGDQVLQAVAAAVQGSLPPGALKAGHIHFARWGGEEFLLLLTGEVVAQAPALADALLRRMRRAELAAGVRVTFSGGLAYSHEAATVPAWLHLADLRQYEAKRRGRDQIYELAV